MIRVRRCDVATLAPATRRPDGSVIAEGRVARTGVLVYHLADGSVRRELVPPETLFDADSLASLRLVPLTNTHPPGMLTADSTRRYQVGAIGENTRRDGDWLAVPVAIHDAEAVSDAQAGRRQLSCGYDCDVEMAPGTWQGEPYDAIQKRRVYNHVALVDDARAGSGAALRFDSSDPHAGVQMTDAELTAETRNELPANTKHFAVPERAALPIEDPEHVRAAMARFNQTTFQNAAEKKSAYHRIVARAHELGVNSAGFEMAHGDDASSSSESAPNYHLPGYGQDYDASDAGCVPASSMQKSDRMDKPTEMTGEQALVALNAQIAELTAKLQEAETDRSAQRERADRLDGQIVEVKKDLETANAKLAAGRTALETAAIVAERARADAAEARVSRFDATFETRVRERASLERRAATVLGAAMDFRSLSDREVMAATVRHLDSTADVGKDVPDGTIRGRFDAMIERYHKTAIDIARAAEILSQTEPHADARETYVKRQRDAWKSKPASH